MRSIARPLDDGFRTADPDRRFLAFAVDRLLAGCLDAAAVLLAVRLLCSRGHLLAGVLTATAGALVVALAFAVLLGATGTTPGKALFRLRLVHTGTGEPIGVWPAVLRSIALGVAAAPFGFGLAVLAWTALTDGRGLRQGWHDHLVSSVLLDVRRVPVAVVTAPPVVPRVVNLTALSLTSTAQDPGSPS
ncbi:MAG TPA: RDD family protein [Nocardioides sp.]|uniref:RDD family protein n=1 Tax=Nocardioides sp. TaxID=35761 RepID=UPI002E31C7B8|nr:RDD family protein [Nocardioides sp.]HEX3929986.1 RDD family protein [Nocardioides sp.]